MAPKRVDTVTDPAVAWAEQLWARVESGLLDVQNAIVAIIDSRAWETLGYESFSKAWIDRIAGRVTLAAEIQPHVVYQMFSEGLSPQQVADAVKGVTDRGARDLKRQRDAGTAPEDARITVRRHKRRPPCSAGFVHFKVDHETLLEWRRVVAAEGCGRTLADVAYEATAEAVKRLAR